MYEILLETLPESAQACRRLYDVATGGYHLPLRENNVAIGLAEVEHYRTTYPTALFDCIETPVADLLFSLVVNTRSRWILETGTSRGFSTCHLAAGARFVGGDAARVLTIDLAPAPNPFFAGSAVGESITALRADSLTIELRPLLGAAKFDFMFFDSLHTYAHLSGELARFLPHLKAGGLFMLHDTMVYDDLGLVVTWLAASGRVEAVSLPTHRTHGRNARSPGVSLFRKIGRIETGDLVFPDLAGVVDGERQSIAQPGSIVTRTGSLFTDPRYVTGGLHRSGPRDDDSPALLEAAEALRERELAAVDDTWPQRIADFVALHSSAAQALPLRRHRTVDGPTRRAQDDWWRIHGPLENRLHRWLPEPFAPASQRRTVARLRAGCAGAGRVVHLVCSEEAGPSVLQQALDASADRAEIRLEPLPPDRWRHGLEPLPAEEAYLLDGILHHLPSAEIDRLIARLRRAAPRGARIVVLEPVCFPENPGGDPGDRVLASMADLIAAPGRAVVRENIVVSPATRQARALLAKRWWAELPCGPAPLQRPFVGDELGQRLAQEFELRSEEIVQLVMARELGKELVLLADDEPQLARRMAAELLPTLDELEASILARQPLPDVSWYVSMLTAVA